MLEKFKIYYNCHYRSPPDHILSHIHTFHSLILRLKFYYYNNYYLWAQQNFLLLYVEFRCCRVYRKQETWLKFRVELKRAFLKSGWNIKTHHRKIRCDGYFVHLDGSGLVTASNKLVLCVSEYVRLNKQYLNALKGHIIIIVIIIIINQIVALLLSTCFDLVIFRVIRYKYKCVKKTLNIYEI
jgi:hypothetical protein